MVGLLFLLVLVLGIWGIIIANMEDVTISIDDLLD